MRHALFLPPSGELADPRVHVDLAATAETHGWDALFLWDHVLRPAGEPPAIADPWICLAAAATATTRLKLGTMVTPVTRRRPVKLAREAVSLDTLSGGRVVLGLGLGVDSSGELSKLGEVVDARLRGERLDEGAALLEALWTGERVRFHGQHFVADDVLVLPRPVQQPRIPMWFAARGEARKPVRRAARYDGLVPIEVDAEGLRSMLDTVATERGTLDGFDVAVVPGSALPYEGLAGTGVTWALTGCAPGISVEQALAIAAADPRDAFARPS